MPFRYLALLAFSCVLLLSSLFTPFLVPAPARAQVARTHTITWDSHSLLIDGRRVLLYSGEFHYFRLPSQSQWLDRLEKMKAAGLNAVSIYFDWQYHSSAPGTYDFSGVRDVDALLSMADRLGLYVIARVGPYMNGEIDAGGLPGWVLTQQLNERSQVWNGQSAAAQYSPLYAQDSAQWYDHLLPILARHQATQGKSVILLSVENEYPQAQGSQQYMQELYNRARADGITVPIFANDFNFDGSWSKTVDLYAFDSYPYGFNCCHQWYDIHFHGIDTWEATLRQKLGITTPMFVAELQGGSYDPWGGKGYAAIARTFNGDWLTALDESVLAQGTSILNTYMYVGGTNWGYMGEPGVYTSYDYGAPISESGALRPAYYASHRLAAFLQTYGSSLAASDATSAVTLTDPRIVLHTRIDQQTGQLFLFLRHGDPGTALPTRINLPIGNQTVLVPQAHGTHIMVPGHGAALLTANVQTGPLHLNYSTSQIFTETDTAQGSYLVLYGPRGTGGETDFALPAGSVSVNHNDGVTVTRRNGELRLNYRHTPVARQITIQSPGGTLHLIVTSSSQASRYWVVDHLIISGPDLVEDNGGSISLQNRFSRPVAIYGSAASTPLQIDGRPAAAPDPFNGEVALGNLAGPKQVTLPALSQWKFSPGGPEVSPSFDDSGWALASHTSTNNPNVPAGDGLLADDYGFHYGFVWYRGHFTAAGTETGIQLSARQSYSVYLNGTYLGTADETLADPPHPYAVSRYFAFPPGAVHVGTDNVLAVLTESMGHDEGWLAGPLAATPQGILSAQLVGSTVPVSWRIQGDAGGEHPADTTRGLQNASGLYGEREGWYLPTYDDSSWANVSLPDDWQQRQQSSDLGWYRAHFSLNLPGGQQTPVGITLPHVSDEAVIWINGWQMGRYWEQKGPQHTFYLPAGVLNPHGQNTLALMVWNRGHRGGLTAVPTLTAYAALRFHTLTLDPSHSADWTYWHTSGNRIVDAANRPIRIAAVNWSGMQGSNFVPSGLDRQPLSAIMDRIASLGFNTIRLPFSNALVERNPIVQSHLQANPALQGKHALDILDAIVTAAQARGLRIILDDHRSSPGADPETNGLWYTAQYPESAWIRDWQTLARRYLGNPAVVGVDLRDEPHTGPPGPFSIKTYLHQGATWGPYRGIEQPATDWRLGAERGGDAVLAVNPHLLVFVEGIQQYPDPTQPGGLDSYWWGGILGPAARYPVKLAVPNQLVYSPHEYGPFKYHMRFFNAGMTYRSMVAIWDKHWGFLDHGAGPHVPIFLGEFGTCGSSVRACVANTRPGSQGQWFTYLMRYLEQHSEIGWAFWALNGTNSVGSNQPNYLLNTNWHTLRLHQVTDTLRNIEVGPPPE